MHRLGRWAKRGLWVGYFALFGAACGGVTESGTDSGFGIPGETGIGERTPQRLAPPKTIAAVRSTDDLRASGGFLYWTAYGDIDQGSLLVRMAERGGPVEAVGERRLLPPFTVTNEWVYAKDGQGFARVSLESGFTEAFAETDHCNVARHSATALYCAHGLGLFQVSLSSGDVSQMGQSFGYTAEDLLVDESSLYWIAGGELRRVAQAGGATEVLALGFVIGADLTGDRDALYFSTGGRLFRLPKAGGGPEALRLANVSDLEVFGDHLYWIQNGTQPPATVMATPLRDAGPDVVIAKSAKILNGLAVSDAGVFWSSYSGNVVSANGSSDFGDGELHAAYWP